MGFKQSFSNWSIYRQLQVLFISAAVILCSVLIIITKFQLDWLRFLVINEVSDAFKSRLYKQIENIGYIQASYFESEFSSYEDFTIHLALTDEMINGFAGEYKVKVFEKTTSHSHEVSKPSEKYLYGVYYSKYSSLSAGGSELVKNESVFNYIYPAFYTDYFEKYYQGYYTDEILNFYPASIFSSIYSPLPREWFYRGAENEDKVVITEPYKDAEKGNWVVSLSRGVFRDGEVFGVAACDVSLAYLTEKMQKLKFLKNGFGVLVSATGIILTIPDIWQSEKSSYLRIYDSFVTGISLDTWLEIKSSPDSSWVSISIEENSDYDISAADLRIFKKDIIPSYQTNITHYLLLIVDKSDTTDVEDSITDSFEYTYTVLFWVILAFGITFFAIVFLLSWCFGSEITKQFSVAGDILGGLLRRGFFSQSNRPFDHIIIKKGFIGVEKFIKEVSNKVIYVEQLETQHEKECWVKTRPEDYMFHDEWKKMMYPKRRNSESLSIWDSKVEKVMEKFK